jgi:hypothetical protein
MRGFLFSLDALLAALILIGGLIVVTSISQHHTSTDQLSAASEDVLLSLSEIRIDEMDDLWVQGSILNGSITDTNSTVLEQIGYYWATGYTAEAQQLAALLLSEQYPNLGVRLTIDGDEIYARNSTKDSANTLVSSRMVSGIASGQAITGSSAVAYLRRIKDKRTSSFTTFGGFVGQGNLTVSFLDLPADANITQIYLEVAPGAPFTIAFNNVLCGGTRTASSYNGTPGSWDLSSCNTSLVPGATNVVSINFSSQLNASYIAGGYLRVKYKTSQLTQERNSTFVQYRLPGIDGILNLYDSFYVPGTLLNMSIYLHYNSSNSTFVDVGEKRVWENTPNGTPIVVILNDSYLRNASLGKLDYDFLSNKTVPFRMSGFSYNQTVVTSGDADVVVITDFTGSMKKSVSDWTQGNLGSDCDGAFTDSSIRRTKVAQCVDHVLVNTIMNYSGNRVWSIFIFNNQILLYNNPTNWAAINGSIDTYNNGQDKTCLACALNMAYDVFTNFSNSSRKKFIVLMSDGAPTHCANGGCTSNSTAYGTLQCQGMCDTNGACGQSDIPGQCTECTNNPGGQTNAYYSANRSRIAYNATIFTVGFGPITDCTFANMTLGQIALIGNGTYQHSNNSAQLKVIYNNISQEILTRTNLNAQLYAAVGQQARSQLYSDSYMNVTYDLAEQYLPTQNEITIQLQTSQACYPIVPLYAEQQLVDVKAISYSSTHWSDYMAINGVEAFNLSNYLVPYDQLGDPGVIQAPISLFVTGNNTIRLETGDSATNRSGCFVNDSAIYTVSINLSTERSTVVPNSEGCFWAVQFEDGTFENITIPAGYTGPNRCSYVTGNITYDGQDAYQLGAYNIFNRLDFNKDGTLFVNLRNEDLEVIVTTISRVPYMWGPSIVKLEVTQ